MKNILAVHCREFACHVGVVTLWYNSVHQDNGSLNERRMYIGYKLLQENRERMMLTYICTPVKQAESKHTALNKLAISPSKKKKSPK